MRYIFTTALAALRSLLSTKMLMVLIGSIAINAVLLLIIFGLVSWAAASTSLFMDSWFEWLFDWATHAIALWITMLLFPIFLPIVISFFDDAIASDIEQREFPNLPTTEPPFWPTFMQDVGFTVKAILLNILVLPLYILFFFIPFVPVFIYYTLNGYLLGTEFFNMAAGRHIPVGEAKTLRRKHRLTVIGGGALIAFCATIPFINLLTPLWGVAFMVHFFHGLKPKYLLEKTI